MEVDNSYIFHPAIIEEVTLSHRCVTLKFRGRKDSIWDPKRKSFNINVIWLSDDTGAQKLFVAAQRLSPGDEIWMEANHECWYRPKYCNIFRRLWNLWFG